MGFTRAMRRWIGLANLGPLLVIVAVLALMKLTFSPTQMREIKKAQEKAAREAEHAKLLAAETSMAKSRSKRCVQEPLKLMGEVPLDYKEVPNLERESKAEFQDVEKGGLWKPRLCKADQSLAVIIPYRDTYGDRNKNLKHLIVHLHTVLRRQLLDYIIIVAQQNGTSGWMNKGLMMNLGYMYATGKGHYDCIVFHDVDMIPIDDRNLYKCEDQPKHLSANVDNKPVKYNFATGGALSMKAPVFKSLNGFSNRYWGWGNEDDDMYARMQRERYILKRANPDLANYVHLNHKRTYQGTNYRPATWSSYRQDGLNSLHEVSFKLLEIKRLPLYTLLNYSIKQPSNR